MIHPIINNIIYLLQYVGTVVMEQDLIVLSLAQTQNKKAVRGSAFSYGTETLNSGQSSTRVPPVMAVWEQC